MKVLFINNDGGGFADYIEVNPGITVEKLFQERLPHGKAQDYLIRVNRQPVSANQELMEGDRLTICPTKIHGALST
jgi:hypothetical protein